MSWRRAKTAVLITAFGASALTAQEATDATRRTPQLPDASCVTPEAEPERTTETPAVLVEGLGYAGVEADSSDPEARAWFAQGVRLIWAFDEAEAIRAFQQAQRLDPECALCHWGEAWARSPTINLRPRTAELPTARAAAAKAAALAEGLSARDRFLVRAMERRTGGAEGFESEAYAALMENAALRMPGDDLVAILAADARMIAQPPGEFRPGSLSQRLLERVLARNPDHGGAIHFYIHLTDWVDRQYLAEPYADRLARIAPAASHLIHMPSHTYYGVGRYGDATAANVKAIAADQIYEARVTPPASDYRRVLLRHNMQFAINSALARGDGRTALAVAEEYRAAFLAGEEIENGSRLLGSAVSYALGLHAPVGSVLDRVPPENENAIDKAMRLYARGEALARRGDGKAVRAEAEALAALRESAEAPALGRSGNILAEIAQNILEGRAAMLNGDAAAAEKSYRKAMQAQLIANFSADPPLFWYSVRRSLAAALIAGGEPGRAKEQLYASLRRWPNDPLALYALSLAEQALGETESAARNLARARSGWAGEIESIPLARI